MAGQDKKKSKKAGGAAPVITDPRFANIQSDPRYRLPSKRQTHVKLDKRFQHMLDDKDFSRNAAVDRYGRKLARDDTKKQLKKFYQIDEDEDEKAEDEDKVSIADDDEIEKELKRVEGRSFDPARDGGFSESSSEEESSSDEEEEVEAEEEEEELEFPDKQQADVPLGEVSTRIAVVNLDWDNIRATDLMAVFSSFLPAGGRVMKVAVYPSEFGKERMEREEIEGPPKEIFASSKQDVIEDEDEGLDSEEEEEQIKKSMLKGDSGEEFNSTKLRKYQLERLRYYYAILTFSSKDAAKHVYDLVDGAEYLSSANFFDLRFVPDETDFDDDKPRDDCTRIPDGYKPNEFVTDALQHSKVKLTWDADDKTRKEAQARAFRGSRKDIDENDLKAYLGSDSSDSEDEEDGGVEVVDAGEGTTSNLSKREAERQRMRALLGLSTEPTRSSKSAGPVGEMEVTFTSGLAGGHGKDSIFENEPEVEESTLDKYVRKERERKKRRKEKLKAKNEDPSAEGEDAESQDESAPAPEAPQDTEEDLGFNDPFFAEDFDGRATSAARRKEEKRKKREERAAEEAASAAQRAELELLMVDDKKADIKHFDMNEIEKAEKQAKKKGKGKGKGKGKNKEPVATDDFNVDVADPRFSRLYDSHEFAIDPTNPRFKATSGMNALLDEGRKRRRTRDDSETEVKTETRDRKKKQKKSLQEAGSEDLKRLVDKVKRQSKA
ncbi:hypothetical protein N7448_009669 [Penicillium atrosanguineum]|uniref:NUC153 domain-containing protein n=1 Tax=Penicillium atrosanguineum TaxID=1132637 RepID=A0A9W9Q1E0_9EURO|nr:uncharacterized protein N7443_006916 [Penicillium atrosanguineum]KAJ5123572.1 hypothetical protein N7448_009669 [Penicillium atrosanguineum]KAJ5142200.1 hypothetical protein N7526_003195 [Penicillium atrosanguineum]KAJ5298796.1 hypothetical protein N7443_006916 [Penicillium atrosanguineum]KAJ5320939.1 hypothetical protein N7476_003941 [Penicillium atrosanguineum]